MMLRRWVEKFQIDKLIKFKMAAYRPLFTWTGLILWNIMKTAQDIYTITIKQIVRFQERMHFEKIQLVQVKNGRQSGTWMIASSSTFCPHLGRVIRDLFRLLNAV